MSYNMPVQIFFSYLFLMPFIVLRVHKTESTPMQNNIAVFCHSYWYVHYDFHSTK